jgi:transposase
VDEELEAPLPKRCPKCGGAIGQCRVEEQYQSEIVRKTHVIRFRVHVGACNDCGARVQGRHPQQTSDALGAAVSHLGPDAVALATLLNKQVGTSVAKTAAILQQTFGLRVTPGGVSHAVARVGRKCAPTYERLKQGIRASASVTLDDTGWKVGGSPHWLFAAATAAATAFAIAARRGHAEAATLLGADFDGFLVRDGAAIYRLFEQADQQSCSAHIINRCNRLIERASGAAAVFPRQVKALMQQGLALRDRFAGGQVSEHGLRVATGRLEATLDRLLGPRYRSDENRRLAKHLDREFDFLFTYLKCPRLEATNYRAEHAIRPAAVIRKVWGGNRTAHGARTQEILMSVLRTSHQNDVDPLPLFADLLRSPHVYVLDIGPHAAAPT